MSPSTPRCSGQRRAHVFFGFLRSGEATIRTSTSFDPESHLPFADVALDFPTSPTKVLLRIKASKTDPFRQGVTVCLGKTNRELCPVAALLSYTSLRGTAPGPLFRYDSGQPLTHNALVREIRARLQVAGLKAEDYAGHSLRIGAATTAAAAGLSDSLIKTMGRWQSSAYLLYVWVPRNDLAAVSAHLAAQ